VHSNTLVKFVWHHVDADRLGLQDKISAAALVDMAMGENQAYNRP